MLPLDAELLRARTTALVTLATEVAGPVEEHLFDRLMCDGCGLIVDLRQGFPSGWSTDGDLKRGFTDLCPSCIEGER